jgi:hypothetical protein
VDQRVEQIGGENDADREADDGFDHGGLLKPVAGDGVEAHQREKREWDGDVDDVGHGERPFSNSTRSFSRRSR